jgi:hypothetical protein
VLSQSARVYLTAIVLELILGETVFDRWRDLTGISTVTWAIWTVGVAAIIWTLMGGIVTVIWTDVIQFGIMVLGAVLTLWYAVGVVPGGWSEVLDAADCTKRFVMLDLRTDPALAYTLWCGLLATPFLNLAALGTDQVMAQRMFWRRGTWAHQLGVDARGRDPDPVEVVVRGARRELAAGGLVAPGETAAAADHDQLPPSVCLEVTEREPVERRQEPGVHRVRGDERSAQRNHGHVRHDATLPDSPVRSQTRCPTPCRNMHRALYLAPWRR